MKLTSWLFQHSCVEGSALLLQYQSGERQVFLSSNAGSNCAENYLSQKKTKAGLNQKKAAKHGHQPAAQPAGRTASEVIRLQAQHSTNEELRQSETNESYTNQML